MKGQYFSLLFILLFIFILISSQTLFHSKTSLLPKKLELSSPNYEVGKYLLYSKLASIYSYNIASYEVGLLGGNYPSPSSKTKSWACNDWHIPSVNELKDVLNGRAYEYFKDYLLIYPFPSSIPFSFSNKPYLTCKLEVDEKGVFMGKYDEGFPIHCESNSIYATSKEVNLKDTLFLKDYISNNRFWYMYRTFYNWAKTTSLKECFISSLCLSPYTETFYEGMYYKGPRGKVTTCIKQAFKELTELFDSYVSCKYTELCYYYEEGKKCINLSYWKNPYCTSPCISKYNLKEEPIFPTSNAPREGKSALYIEFSCIDHKYKLPLQNNLKELEFRIRVYFSFRKSCYTELRECPYAS